MNGTLGKVLIGISLAVLILLAVPLGLMTSAIIQGESPKQLAEKENSEIMDSADQPEDEEDLQQPDSSQTAPQADPDPGPASPPAGPEPDAAPAASSETEPEPKQNAKPAAAVSKKTSSNSRQSVSDSGSEDSSDNADISPKNISGTAEESAQLSRGLPKAVLAPGEAPCMIDGLDGFSYDYTTPPSNAEQPAQDDQEAPPLPDGADAEDASDLSGGELQQGSDTAEDGNPSIAPQSSEIQETYTHKFLDGKLLGTVNSNKYHYKDCIGAQKIPPENEIWFNSVAEAQAAGYGPCGICY